jgi:hypothetical protein
MNILIIGIGNIGRAHLNGILKIKKNFNIYLYDKKKINFNFEDDRIKIIKQIPKNKNFLLVIISTDNRYRLKIIKNLISNKNTINYLLLEKYIFKDLNEFHDFEKKYLKQIFKGCYINCWGKILFDSLGLKSINKIKEIEISINKSSYLTSFIHFLQIVDNIKKISFKEKYNLKINKIFNSKRKGFKEVDAIFNLYKKKFTFTYGAKNIDYSFIINFKFADRFIKIILKDDFKLSIHNKGKISRIRFPLSSETTKDFLLSIINNKKISLPKYKEISKLNRFIIKIFQKKLSSRKFT